MKRKYYIGLSRPQFLHFTEWMSRNKVPHISDARTSNQSEYTVLLRLSDEDLTAIKLTLETQWIRKANW